MRQNSFVEDYVRRRVKILVCIGFRFQTTSGTIMFFKLLWWRHLGMLHVKKNVKLVTVNGEVPIFKKVLCE